MKNKSRQSGKGRERRGKARGKQHLKAAKLDLCYWGRAQINKMRFQKEHRSHSGGSTGHLSCKFIFAFSKLKPLHLNSPLSSLTKLKNLKSQILHLKSLILNSQTSNLKISNPKALGVGGMSRRLGIRRPSQKVSAAC